jgi:hypothetical protein
VNAHAPGLPPDHRGTPRREPDRDYEHSVLRLLEQHAASESSLLESYERVADRSDAGEAVQFLVRLILDDERRHHEVFEQMANGIRSFVWEVPVEPRLPAMSVRSDPELLAETKRLLEFERHDAKELKRLRKTLRSAPRSSLDPLMVQLMLRDTQKHIAILEYIESHLGK